jgi:hypothetical protein
MTRGVIYYNLGNKCITRMLVSMYSLRKHYTGPMALLTEGSQHQWFLDAVKDLGCTVVPVVSNTTVPPLVRKAQLQEWSPFDATLFFDADTIILKPIDSYFDKIEEFGFCTGEFAGWESNGRKIAGRIDGFKSVCTPAELDTAKKYGKATNTGIFGFLKDSPFLAEWKELTIKGWQNNCSRIPDEVACQILLPKYRHWLAPVEWGVSVKHGYQPKREDCIVIHYHGRKHASDYPLCTLWKSLYWEYQNLPKNAAVKAQFAQDTFGDRRLKRYLKSLHKNITIVSAVNPPYMDALRKHMPQWMETPGIMEYPGMLFYNGVSKEDLSFVPPHWELIPWDMPVYDSLRELMLTSFVIGTAQHVKTKFWIKLDADVEPRYNTYAPEGLKLPNEVFDNDISGHKWGYSKPGKWLRTLEDWFDKTAKSGLVPPRVFTEEQLKDADVQKRYGHERIASFICFHKSGFVRDAAAMCENGRMPVPSHDTFLWYVAKRQRRKIHRFNLKANFTP